MASADIRPKDHDERMKVARRYAEWHLGSGTWAHRIVAAYLYPESITAELDWEQAEDGER